MDDEVLLASGEGAALLSLFFMMGVKEISQLGRKCRFPRPRVCLREGCGSSRIWAHGFVTRYFDDCAGGVELRRWRCADCGCMYVMRPFGYWPRHHAPVRIILKSLCCKVMRGFWNRDLGLSRQRQEHWLRALTQNILIHLGLCFGGGTMFGFHELVPLLTVPVIRSA